MENQVIAYQTAIKKLLTTYQPLKTDHSRVVLLFDDQRMEYMAVRLGWFKQQRIHQCLLHLTICDGVVIIQANNTEDPIMTELAELGVPQEKIQLGFLPPLAQPVAVQAPSDLASIAKPCRTGRPFTS